MSKKDKNDENGATSKKERSSGFRKRSNKSEPKETPKGSKSSRSARRKRSRRPGRVTETETIYKSQTRLWIRQNWKIMGILLLIFLFGLFLRSYYYYTPATENGFILSGNDPYYHKRVVDYVQENHEHLIWDPLLQYPDGSLNPRPPFFDWSIAIVGLLLAPFFGGNADVSTWQVMEFAPAFWGALTAIPAYLIGKEMFNKKVGLISAFLLATMPSHVERSPLAFSDHDAIVLFFVVLAFFFFIKALNQLKSRDKWVEDWKKPREIPKGIKEWFKYNQVSVSFAVMTGLSLATVAFIWKGFLYAAVIIIVYFFIQLVLNKLRNKDSLGVAICTIIPLAIVAFLPMPYYYGNRLDGTIEPAAEMLLAVVVVSAVLVPTRDSPWLLVFSTLAAILVAGIILFVYVFPDIGATYLSGQGYFGDNKIFSTIAEAQAPDYSRAMFSYGIVTTFLGLFGILLSIIRVAKDLKTQYLFMTIWGITSVYMAVSATRFIFNAGPIFAILSGWIIYELVVKLDFKRMLKHYKSLKGGGRFYAMKKSVKVRHIAGVLFLVFMILIPNVWLGWDAGVPFGEKKDVDVAVYDAMPFFLKPPEHTPDGDGVMYNRTNFNDLKYFGAFGHGFPSDYWLDSMQWLSEQDTEVPIEERPAFISWWDYGFWSVQLGDHPTAADNFQGRVQYAGSFISARNENQSISLLIARILQADKDNYRYKDGHKEFRLHDEVRAICQKYFGVEKTQEIEDVLVNTPNYVREVLDNPDRYGYYSDDLVPQVTPIYAVLQTWIPELLSDDERVWLLHELQEETGFSLRYFAIDSRLFPYGPQNTGIYYAPLKLSDHRISDTNEPYDFVQTIIVGDDNREYTLEEFRKAQEKAQESGSSLEAQDFKLKYYEPFLDSMLMKCYLGYTLDDINAQDTSVSNVEPNLPAVHAQNYPPMQAWMMKHYQLVYRTSYRNPFNTTEYQKHPDAWKATDDARGNDLIAQLENDGIDNDNNGIVDDRGEGGVISSGLRSGVVYIKYYEGAYLNGTVTTTKGTPVPGIRVSVADEYGIPHDSDLTDENGTYHIIAPSGNVSLYASTGGFGEGDAGSINLLSQQEQTTLNRTNIEISDDQAMRRQIDEDGDGIWDYIINNDFVIEANSLKGTLFWDMDSDNQFNKNIDFNISSAKIIAKNTDRDMEYETPTESDGTYSYDDLTPGIYEISVDIQGHLIPIVIEDQINLETAADETKDIGISEAEFFGNISSTDGTFLESGEIRLFDQTNGTSMFTQSDSEGNFSFKRLLSGNYTVFVEIDGFGDYERSFSIEQGNSTGEAIVLFPSTNVNGVITRATDSEPVPNATIRFQGIEDIEGSVRFVTADSLGTYSFAINNGKYQVHVKHVMAEDAPWIFQGTMEFAGGDVDYDISLTRSVEVFGVVFRDFDDNGTIDAYESRPYADITFENNQMKVTLKTNSSGFYRVFLPQGDYSVHATYGVTRGSFVGNLVLNTNERKEFNIELINGRTLDGYVYFDINQDGQRHKLEGLSYSILTFTDENGTNARARCDKLGFYSINLPDGRDYTAIAEHGGYLTSAPLGPENLSNWIDQNLTEFSLEPLEVSLSGKTLYNANGISNVSITFDKVFGSIGENATASSDTNGDYSIDILPGEYDVIVNFNTNSSGKHERYTFDGTLFIDIGEGTKVFDLDMTQLVPINGTIFGTTENVTISFDPVDESDTNRSALRSVNGTFETFLVPGHYIVSVDEKINATIHYVFKATFNLTEAQTVDLNISKGVMIEGAALFEGDRVGQDIEIKFINASVWNTTVSAGDFIIFLSPNQTYEVSINFTTVDNGKDVRYTFNDTIDVNDTAIPDYDFNVTKYLRIDGQVYLDWDQDDTIDTQETLDNISVVFESGSDIYSAMTNTTGYYDLFVEIDKEYDVKLQGDFPILDEDRSETPKISETEFNFKIIPENLTLSGTTVNENNQPLGFTALMFKGISPTSVNLTTSSDASGNYSTEISYGTYDVYARKVSGSDVFVYLDKITVRPGANLDVTINMVPGIRINGRAYYINSTEQNLSAEVMVEFGGNAGLSIYTNPEGRFEVWLPEGMYHSFANLTTDEYNISMDYIYERQLDVKEDVSIFMELVKNTFFGVDFEWDENQTQEIPQNGTVTYTMNIRNTGIVKDTYNIAGNANPLWNITVIDNITLDIGESAVIDVQIQASENAKVEHDPILMGAASRSDPGTTKEVELTVNIKQVNESAEMVFTEQAVVVDNNSLKYFIKLTNPGNGRDNFTLTLKNVPPGWNVTLTPNSADVLGSGDSQSIDVLVTIPYNSTVREDAFTVVSTSLANLTSEIEVQVGISNLEVSDSDLSVSGEDVSEGEVNREPIPGFEAFLLIAALLGVAVIMRRRRIP